MDIQIKLTEKETELLEEALRGSLAYIQDLDERNHHPGDLEAWGEQLQLTGKILLKIREVRNGKAKKKK